MKHVTLTLAILVVATASAQVANKQYNQFHLYTHNAAEDDIVATPLNITITTKVLYNAIPDGYHVTFTKSLIGKTVEEVEQQTIILVDNLVKELRYLHITKKDVVLDVVAIDPIFNINIQETSENTPLGYKVTENIMFSIKSISDIAPLSKKCLDFGIYDIINTEAFILSSKPIYDSLSTKAIEVLDQKKKTA